MKRTIVIAGTFLVAIGALVIAGRVTQSNPVFETGGPGAMRPVKSYRLDMPILDPRTGVEVIRISADLKDSAEIKMTGKSRLEHSYEFGKGSVRVPITGPLGARESAEKERARAPTSFTLEFEEASYETLEYDTSAPAGTPQGQSAHISLPSSCTGTFDDGTVLRFKSLDVDYYQTQGLLRLKTTQPVVIEREAPYLRLRGNAGLTGRFDRKENVYKLEFPAPVYAFMRREAGQGFLGLRGADASVGALPLYVCVKCDGVLALDWAARRIVFDRNVMIAPSEGAEVPVAAGNQRVECHRLTVTLDPVKDELAGATAERGPETPVRAFWGPMRVESGKPIWDARAESGKAVWDARADTADLTDDPHLWGKTADLRFDAKATRIIMDNRGRVARLYGPIKCYLDQDVAAAKDKDKLPEAWDLDADYGEVLFNDDKSRSIKEIVATADPALPSPNAVRLQSRKEGAVRAEGGKLVYEVASSMLVVTGAPPRRPFVHVTRPAEKLLAEAEQVSFSFPEGCILLERQVDVKATQKSARAGEHVHRLNADWARIAGQSDSGISRVEARAKDAREPLCLEYDGPPRCRLTGGTLVWERERELAVVSPYKDIAAQSIAFLTGEIQSKEFRFFPAESKVNATGDVVIRMKTENGDFTVNADEAECAVDPTQIQAEGPPALTALRSIRARAGLGKSVTLQGDELQAEAGEIDYDAVDDILLLKGPDRQRFRYTGAAGIDELGAQTVTFVPSENRVTLAGGVSGLVHQKNWASAAQAQSDPRVPSTPWRYEARTAQVQLRREGKAWVVSGLTAQGDIRLANEELPLLVTGDQLTFDPATQTITLGAPHRSASLQTIQYGTPPEASLLRARMIRIQRQERLEEGKVYPEIIGVLTDDVVSDFHLRKFQKPGSLPELVPDKIRVNADNVNLVVPADGSAQASSAVLMAQANGHVSFQTLAESPNAPAYSGSGARAEYQHNPFRFRLFGDAAQGKAAITHPLGTDKAQVITLKRRSDGSPQIILDDSTTQGAKP